MVNCLHGPILKQAYPRSLLFLIYINDLSASGCLLTMIRFFLWLIIVTVVDNNDLSKITGWANQWKMNFNPDPNKVAQGGIFSCNIKKDVTPSTNLS